MPCQLDEEGMNIPAPEPPCTPTKTAENDGTRANAATESESSSDSDMEMTKKRKKTRGPRFAEWTVIKRWITGDLVVMQEEDIDREMLVAAP